METRWIKAAAILFSLTFFSVPAYAKQHHHHAQRNQVPSRAALERILQQAIANMPKGSVITSGIWQVGQGTNGRPDTVAPFHKLTNHPLVTVYCAQNSVNAQYVVDNAENVVGGVVQNDIYAGNAEAHYAASLTLTKRGKSVSEGYYIVSGPAK